MAGPLFYDDDGRITPEKRQEMRETHARMGFEGDVEAKIDAMEKANLERRALTGSPSTNVPSSSSGGSRASNDAGSALGAAHNLFTEYDDKVGPTMGSLDAQQLRKREEEQQQREDYEHGTRADPPEETVPQSAQLGKGYNPEKDDGKGGKFKKAGKKLGGLLKRRKALVIGSGGVLALVVGLMSIATTFLPWELKNLMSNIDSSTFARLQGVDVRDRSSKWLQAYMTARLIDIEGYKDKDGKRLPYPDGSIAPEAVNSSIVPFRADRVDNNEYFTDWYKTMRTSKFEYDLFQKYGIKFTSSFYHDGNKIVVRPAIITIHDRVAFDFDLEAAGVDGETVVGALAGDVQDIQKIRTLYGDINGRIQVEAFGTNQEGRKELKRVMKQMLPIHGWKIWNAVKRYHIRRDIQNMTGITSWVFFEKTREKFREKRIDVRNKMLSKALPTNTKSGKFLRCLFGVDSCRASTDPSSPDNRNLPVDGENDNGRRDGDAVGNGTGEDSLSAGATDAAAARGDASRKIAVKILANGGLALGVVSFLDSISRFDKAITSGLASTEVTVAKGQSAAALYTEAHIASDQLETGQVVGDEVNATMEMFSPSTNNESYATLREDRPNIVNAQEFTAAEDKEEFCSLEHQEEARKPENRIAADKEFQHLCPLGVIGSASVASEFEAAYNNSIGVILSPIMSAWRSTLGTIVAIFENVISAILDPIVKGLLNLLGLSDNIEELMGWIGQKLLELSGGGPIWDKHTLPGQMVNILFQGGTYVAEGASRGQGAAATTPATKAETTRRYYAYEAERRANMSINDRYLSLDNNESLASRLLFAFLNRPANSWATSTFSSMGSALTAPLSIISTTVHAATPPSEDPYAAAKLAMIDTYDFPRECLDAEVIDMTPQSATNADDEGIFRPEELNWDLMTNKDTWYNEVYARVGEDDAKAKRIWNCALLDNAVAGGMGALYGFPGNSSYGTLYKRE